MGVDGRAGAPGRVTRRQLARRSAACLGAGLLAGAGAWTIAGVGWVVDLATPFTAHTVVLACLGTLVFARARARAGAVLCAVAALVGMWGVTRGRDLLPPGSAPTRGTVRVLVYNAHSENTDHAATLGVIRRADADVVVLIEPEIELSRDIRWRGELEDAYPSWSLRAWVPQQVSPILILSRLPIAWVGPEGDPADEPYALAGVVETPFGEMGVVAGQPLSPRSAARWREGERQTRAHVRLIESLRARRIPVVFGADLNSAACGSRGRMLARAGVRPCKPLLEPAGTFPSWLPWPARISIDDAWRTPDLRVVSWRVLGAGGSDHEAVLVELAPAGQAARESSP